MSSRRALPPLDAVRRVAPRVALAIGGALMAAGAGMVTLYAVPGLQLVHPYAVMASAFIPYGIVAFAGSGIIFATSPRRWARPVAMAAVAGMLLQGWWARPYWPAAAPEPGASSFTLITMNMRCDSRGIADLAALTQRVQPDVVVVQGLNATKRAALGDAWARLLPHSTFHPMAHLPTCGTFVFSRTPLRQLSASGDAQPVLEVDRPHGAFVLLPVDLPTPRDDLVPWLDAFAHLSDAARAHRGLPLVLAGDFNAVREHAPMRRLLLDTGLRDAAEVAGSGWTPTFPSSAWHPPLLALDHVLIGPEFLVPSIRAEQIDGQEHGPLVVKFALLRS